MKKRFYKTPKKELALYAAKGTEFIMNDKHGIEPFYADELTQAIFQVGRIKESLRGLVVGSVIPKIKKIMQIKHRKTLRYNRRTQQWEPTEKGMPEVLRKARDGLARITSSGFQIDVDYAKQKIGRVTPREKAFLSDIEKTQDAAKKFKSQIDYLEDKQTQKAKKIIARIQQG